MGDLFREEWKHAIFNEIGDQWDYLIPSLQKQWTLHKYIMILCAILFFTVPINVWLFGSFDAKQKIFICGSCAICFLIIGTISCWYYLHGLGNKFRKRFIKLLKSYVRELPDKFAHFDYTLLYPVIYRFSTDNIDPQEQIYCILRISDGVVFCDTDKLEPIHYTTSERMKKNSFKE